MRGSDERGLFFSQNDYTIDLLSMHVVINYKPIPIVGVHDENAIVRILFLMTLEIDK